MSGEAVEKFLADECFARACAAHACAIAANACQILQQEAVGYCVNSILRVLYVRDSNLAVQSIKPRLREPAAE